VKRPSDTRPGPPHPTSKRATTSPSPRVSTIPRVRPPATRTPPKPVSRIAPPRPALRPPKIAARPHRQIAHIIEQDESTLLDLIDNLLNKGVMLNADLVLALANVDLVYIRLSALLCAADRVMPSMHPPNQPRRRRR
jgi:gas vesicle structural protein